jgi:hypothetical protein
MATVFTIAGSNKLSSLLPDWRISETLNGRDTATFSVLSLDGSYRPAGGAEVVFEHDGNEFGGHIWATSEAGLGGEGVAAIVTTCDVVGYAALADRRRVEITIAAGSTLKQALQQIVTYLTPYGVSLDVAQVDGPTLADEVVFEDAPLTSALDKLAVITAGLGTGYIWQIDHDKVLRMYEAGSAAPAAPQDGADRIGDIRVTPASRDTYGNYILVRFTTEAQVAHVYLQAAVNFTATDTVTIASKPYTFKAAITGGDNVDGNVKIGASLEASLQNLRAAINLDSGGGSTYAAVMTVNPDVVAFDQSSTLMLARAKVAGVAGNSIACSEASTDAGTFWTIGGGSAVSTLQFGADEALSGEARATSGAAAADLVDRVYAHPEIRHQDTAQAMANGYLARDSATPKTILYQSIAAANVRPGQSITFTEADRNVSGSALVTSRGVTCNGSIINYDIELVSGSVVPISPLEVYKSWRRGGDGGRVGSPASTTLAAAVSASLNGAQYRIPYFTDADLLGTSSLFLFDGTHLVVGADNGGLVLNVACTTATNGDVVFDLSGGTVAGTVYLLQSYANASGDATLQAVNSGAGNATINLETQGAGNALIRLKSGGTDWTAGIDNADSDRFKVTAGTDVNASNVLQASTGGDVGIGLATAQTLSARVHVRKTTEQLRLDYDVNNYLSVTVGSAGAVTYNATGSGAAHSFSDPVTHASSVTDAGAVLQTGVISPTQLVANTDDWSPTGLATANVIRLDVNGALNLTGIVAQASGTILTLYNKTAYTVTLTHDATSAAPNRFYCPGATNYALLQKASVRLRYDGTDSRWTVQ